MTRRSVVGLAAAIAGCRPGSLRRRGAVRSPVVLPDLLSLAGTYVDLAVADRDTRRLWGRIGGTPAERQASRLFYGQMAPIVDDAWVESFEFFAHRPRDWRVVRSGGAPVETAMPMPFDARLPSGPIVAPLVEVVGDDWAVARGKWALARTVGPAGLRQVRAQDMYRRSVEAGAAGLVVAADALPGRWQYVPPVDKPFAVPDADYPDGIRPIPALCCDFIDGEALAAAAAAGEGLSWSIEYESRAFEGLNSIGLLQGTDTDENRDRAERPSIVVLAHLDSFFQGAHDNAGGLAVLIAMAHRLAALPAAARLVDYWFVALAAHHDRSEGLRAFRRDDPKRWASVVDTLLVEHVDAQAGAEGEAAGWPASFNDQRTAFVGPEGRPEIVAALPQWVRETGLMTTDPLIRQECIGDLHVTCGDRPGFCLMQAAPYYHTDHDTLDKLSEPVLKGAVDFHLKVLELMSGVSAGTLTG